MGNSGGIARRAGAAGEGCAEERLLHGLLLRCGFRDVLWPSPYGQLWGVVGELESGLRLVLTCMPRGRHFRLHVEPREARAWVRELLVREGAGHVELITGELETVVERATPWIAGAVGLGAIALFGWVMATIVH